MRRRSLVRTAATTAVVAGTATAVSGRVARKQQAKAQAAAAPAPQYAPAPAPAVVYEEPAPAGGLSPDAIAQLKALADLKEQGILTQAEFDAQKAQVLGS